jgi:hypothetical protein|nr:MAG TPA: hypothetical protein [Caudoviricetes sp.]
MHITTTGSSTLSISGIIVSKSSVSNAVDFINIFREIAYTTTNGRGGIILRGTYSPSYINTSVVVRRKFFEYNREEKEKI